MHNCVVWNNGTPVQGTHSGRITFCAIEGSEYAEDGNISLSSSNTENSGTRLSEHAANLKSFLTELANLLTSNISIILSYY